MLTGKRIRYEVADRARAIGVGGLGAIHNLAQRVGLVEAIDRNPGRLVTVVLPDVSLCFDSLTPKERHELATAHPEADKAWETAVGDVNSAGRWLQDQGIAAPGKLAIVGWSYGGYAALQSQVLDPDLFKAIVAIAPVTDLERWREEFRDQANYLVMDNFIGRGPHIDAGSPARHADSFKAPVLLFHGDADINVGMSASRLMESRLKAAGKPVTYVEFPNLDHQLDSAEVRARMLSQSDEFLRRHLGL